MKLNYYFVFLTIFVLVDLSHEIRILVDHFTFNALYFAFYENPLSFFIILSFPYLFKNLNK